MKAHNTQIYLVTWIRCLCITGVALCMLGAMRCSLDVAGGFGSETTNGKVLGRAFLPGGEPAGNVTVAARPTSYVSPIMNSTRQTPHTNRDGITDAQGYFELDSLDTGTYTIEINDGYSSAVMNQCVISFSALTKQLGNNTLQAYATISGEIGSAPDHQTRYVQVYGLERLVPVDSTDRYTIHDLPAGIVSLRIISIDSVTQPATVITDVTARSGDTTNAPHIGWEYSKSFVLNTSSSGVGIFGTVVRFPVLIRLNASNFLFNQAKKNGEDIRFVKADNSPLPFEIEWWDSVNNHADIWVTVDTLHGNNSTQSITMLWGNPYAHTLENSGQTFANDNGFVGVWHFSPPDTFSDATDNALDLTDSGTVPVQSSLIGWSRDFDSTHLRRTDDPRLNITDNLTLSAWVKPDSAFINSKIIGKSTGFDGYILAISDMGLYPEIWAPKDTTNYYSFKSGGPITIHEWVHIAVTWEKGGSMIGYINGFPVDIIPACADDMIPNATDLVIGVAPWKSWEYLTRGEIDEVRISNTARSSEWIKLCYMNQNENNTLVVNR